MKLYIMQNFIFQNPVKILFGKGMASEISGLIPAKAKILLLYGGGSVKKNGSYDQTVAAIGKRKFIEFSGIEPNPEYATCMKAVKLIKDKKIDFIIALGGGSVIDACKFISAAALYKGKDPWDILEKDLPVKEALPFGTVLTLPATGSEMNMNAVVSRREICKKLSFASEKVFPQFSVLDPTFTFTLPARQTRNGVIDAFVHVMEQYLTRPANAEIQDRFSESIAQTLVKEGPIALKKPEDYDCRANIMFAATMALNHLICCGVPQDWSSHLIGHEITALYGLDHAETLAIVMPKVLEYKKAQKLDKLVQLGKRVFGINEKSKSKAADATILAMKKFFVKMGAGVELKSYKLPADAPEAIGKNIAKNYDRLGENADITPEDVVKIMKLYPVSGVGLPTRTLGAENFPPRFFFALRKSAYRCVDNIRANLIAQKKRLKSSRRFFGRGASLQGAELMSWIAESKTTFYCGLRVILPRRGFCKARKPPRDRRRRARNPGCRSRLQIRMWHSRRLRGR